jgi:hypothetical protein
MLPTDAMSSCDYFKFRTYTVYSILHAGYSPIIVNCPRHCIAHVGIQRVCIIAIHCIVLSLSGGDCVWCRIEASRFNLIVYRISYIHAYALLKMLICSV